MTTYSSRSALTRNMQDGTELHIFEQMEYQAGSGAYLTIKGTGTQDYDVPLINIGYGYAPPRGTNAEVLAVADGADVAQKLAFLTLPRDKQRPWKENTGGVQNPMDSTKALEFNPDRAHLREENAAIGHNGIVEITGDTVIIRGKLQILGDVEANRNMRCKGDLKIAGFGAFGGRLSAQGAVDAGGSGAFNGLSSGGKLVKTEEIGREPAPMRVDVQFDIPEFKDAFK